MALYFLRHGESIANVDRLFAGQKNDSPLSSLGFEQAMQAAEEMKELHIEKMVSSSLLRARQTASEVAKGIGFDESKIEIDDRITEYDMGIITGTPIRKITPLELASIEDAENPVAFRARVLSFLEEYKDIPQVTLVVSHAGVDRMIQALRLGMAPEQFSSMSMLPNAHPIKLDLEWVV